MSDVKNKFTKNYSNTKDIINKNNDNILNRKDVVEDNVQRFMQQNEPTKKVEVANTNKFKGEVKMKNTITMGTETIDKKDLLFIGCGAAGNNVAHKATQYGFTTLALNTNEGDMAGLDVTDKHILPGSGSGKERSRAKAAFMDHVNKLLSHIIQNYRDKKIIVVGYCANGGTGSGIGPMLSAGLEKNLSAKGINVFLVQICGSIKDDGKAQQNLTEAFEEVARTGVNYLMFDNDKAEDYDTINEDICSALKALTRDNVKANNKARIDMIDQQKLYLDHERMIMVSGRLNLSINSKVTIEEQLFEAVKNNTQLPINSEIKRYGIFLNIPEKAYDAVDEYLGEFQSLVAQEYGLIRDVPEVYKNFQYRDVDDKGVHFTIIITGQSEPVDRYELVQNRLNDFVKDAGQSRTFGDIKKVSLKSDTPNMKVDIVSDKFIMTDDDTDTTEIKIDVTGFEGFLD